jgi:hypothetical protein
MDNKEDKTRSLISAGSDITGNVTGAAIGLLAAGPIGAVLGAASGPVVGRVINKICTEIYDRQISKRQISRAGATAGFAIMQIKERLDTGEEIRNDDFFDEKEPRSSAEEILEGVMIKSHNEHEEKKAKYYANIFVTAAFDTRFTPESLNHFLSLAERLTYRQLCILQVFSSPHKFPLSDEDYSINYLKTVAFEKMAVLHEMYDLYQLRLLECRTHGDGGPDPYMSFDQIHPAWMFPSDLGEKLRRLMQLQMITQADLLTVAIFFRE